MTGPAVRGVGEGADPRGPIDVDAARAETPGTLHRNHLDNAGAALSPASVTAAVVDHLRR